MTRSPLETHRGRPGPVRPQGRARRRYPRAAPAARRSRPSRLTSMESHRPGVTDFVHVGLVVEDLDETVRFLALLGFDCGEAGVFSGEWIDRIIGLENRDGRARDGARPRRDRRVRGGALPLAFRRALKSRRRPRTVLGSGTSPSSSTTCAASSTASETPAGKRSGRSSTSRTPSSFCYVRGPEGLIVELAERVDGALVVTAGHHGLSHPAIQQHQRDVAATRPPR